MKKSDKRQTSTDQEEVSLYFDIFSFLDYICLIE